MQSNKENRLEYLIGVYSDMILRLSYSYLGNLQDAQDACQSVFIKLYSDNREFNSEEHEKAFIIRITINECKDVLKSGWNNRICFLNDDVELIEPVVSNEDGVIWAVKELDEKYRTVIYLHYYEGYKCEEIADILDIPSATVRTRLSRGREMLKKIIGGMENEAV